MTRPGPFWRGLACSPKLVKWLVYPGVDLVYYGNQQQLEYDLVVAPGADPKAIHLQIEGAANLSLSGASPFLIQRVKISGMQMRLEWDSIEA